MSRLEELIRTLCPDGVEYKPIASVATVGRGKRVVKSQLTETGMYPVFQNSLKPLGYYTESNLSGNMVFVIGAGAAGEIGYSEAAFWAADDCFFFEENEIIDNRFLYHVLLSLQKTIFSKVRKASIPRLSRSVLENLVIPVPPLEVQSEIVRILDNFTELTAELIAELTAELAARKQQYEYYMNQQLMFNNSENVTWKKISDICKKISSGGTPKSSNSDYYGGNIPWVRTQEVKWADINNTLIKITKEGLENSSAKWIPENCVIVAMYGATAGKVAVNKISLTTNQACCNLQIDEKKALYRYVYYWLCREYNNIKALGQGSQSNINVQKIKQFQIPIPPLDIQERIVRILDFFNNLCSDFNVGLPEEIELRQKQYEYYRDKLLTFKEKPA